MSLCDRFVEIRKYYGLSQPEFAQKINKTQGFVSSVEAGKSDISTNTIKAICSIFNVNEVWLKTGKGNMFENGQEVAKVDKENIGLRIKQIRKQEKLTQEEFASAIGYSKKQIYYVETNKVTPSNNFLRKIATTFSVNYSWIISGKGDKEMKEIEVSEELISWLRKNPDVVRELEIRSGVKGTPEK